MLPILRKEVAAFFSSLIGYVVVGIFLLITGLVMWVFPDSSLLEYNYATLNQLFDLAPVIFLFLIPAVTMRTFSEEWQRGTIELLMTRPVSDWQIVLGKYGAAVLLLVLALLPTAIYFYSVYQLGSPVGNLDIGGTLGSYLGLFFLAATFAAVGVFSSALTTNQIVAFLLAVGLCFLLHYGFYYISRLPVFYGRSDAIVQMLGIDYHYRSISRGVLDSRDLLYFGSVVFFFLAATQAVLAARRV